LAIDGLEDGPHVSATTLRLERDPAGVATVTFDRTRVRNALDWPTMAAFAAAVDGLSCDAVDASGAAGRLRVVVVTGAGTDAFCSGGDQRALSQATSEADGRRVAQVMGDACLALERLPVPTIAAINGYALGGGSEIALACDLRVADETAQLGLVHLRLALIPGWGAGQRLLRLVGYGRAMEMLLTARPYGARELEALGIVNEVAPAGGALPVALALARRIAAADAATVRAVKALLQAGVRLPYERSLDVERALFPALWAAEPHVRALRRFGVSLEGGPASQSDA